MKNYSALAEIARRLYTTLRRQRDGEDGKVDYSANKKEELRWLAEAYSDALRMVLQEFLCRLYPNMECPAITREDAVRFARRSQDDRTGQTPEMLLGFILGQRKPRTTRCLLYGVQRTMLFMGQTKTAVVAFWHGDDKGWQALEPDTPPFATREEAKEFLKPVAKTTFLLYEIYAKEMT